VYIPRSQASVFNEIIKADAREIADAHHSYSSKNCGLNGTTVPKNHKV